MRDFAELKTCELLALGRRALEMGARRFEQLASAVSPDDQHLKDLLRKMALDSDLRAAEVEQQENVHPDDCQLPTAPEEALKLIQGYLTSLPKHLGEGYLTRDAALFFAESLEEETSRLFRVLAEHAREWPVNRLFSELAAGEQSNVHYLRDIVLQY
jgi:rubrerythrin